MVQQGCHLPLTDRLCAEKFHHQGQGDAYGYQGLQKGSQLFHQGQHTTVIMPAGDSAFGLIDFRRRAYGIIHGPGFFCNSQLNML